jgi:two-component system OmpR family sensor kinase
LETAHPHRVRGDGEALRILVRNLIDNAVRYTPPGGTVRVSCRNGDNGDVVLEVADSGPGIPAEERDRAFDRFYRLSATQSGSGLGLAIVKAIAQRHGASITLESGVVDSAHPGSALQGLHIRVHFPTPS